jgi:ABC-type nickel/cobalt efflux system permease component RcnA
MLTAALFAALAFVALGAMRAPSAEAHPLGNFTVNRYSRIELYGDALRLQYVLDMAEIPAFQEADTIDRDGDGANSQDEQEGYLAAKAAELRESLGLRLNGERADLTVLATGIAFPEGQAGLNTLRITMLLQARMPSGPVTLDFADGNYSDRVGWKEIVVRPADGVVLSSSTASAEDVSRELTVYPQDLLTSPLDVRSASATFDATNGIPAPAVDASAIGPAPETAVERPGSGFASLIDNRRITLPVVLIALAAAFGFGALHALEPGHGKTFVAAYFVGVKGTAQEAALLGLIVASTHTVGVFAIGLITLFGSRFILPEDLYPWLSLASAVMVLGLGVRLLASRTRALSWLGDRLHTMRHGHAHEGNDHGHGHHHAPPEPGVSPWRGLIALGLADGLTPSPSALIVLLAAVSLDRIPLGVALIVAFSVGLAAVLTAVSLGLVYARRIMDWFGSHGGSPEGRPAFARFGLPLRAAWLTTLVPTGGALALMAVGVMLTLRALSQPGLPLF